MKYQIVHANPYSKDSYFVVTTTDAIHDYMVNHVRLLPYEWKAKKKKDLIYMIENNPYCEKFKGNTEYKSICIP